VTIAIPWLVGPSAAIREGTSARPRVHGGVNSGAMDRIQHWRSLPAQGKELEKSAMFTLRRIDGWNFREVRQA